MISLKEEWDRLISTAFDYAEKERGSAPTSVFEIYVGHFKTAGERMLDHIEALQAENDKLRAELAKETEFTSFRRLVSEKQAAEAEVARLTAALADEQATRLNFARMLAAEESRSGRLAEALEPFADLAAFCESESAYLGFLSPPRDDEATSVYGGGLRVTVGQCRHARATLATLKGSTDA